jgi:hypothetical protein
VDLARLLPVGSAGGDAAWRHDIENVRLAGSKCGELNFFLVSPAEPVSELIAPSHRGRVAQLAREDRGVWKLL